MSCLFCKVKMSVSALWIHTDKLLGILHVCDVSFLCLPPPHAAFRLRDQEGVHTQSGGRQHADRAQQQQRPLQRHSHGEDRGGRLRRAAGFLQTNILTGGERERPHQHGHRHSHRQGSGRPREPCQVGVWTPWTVELLRNTPLSSLTICY